jgi:hypothetical protein
MSFKKFEERRREAQRELEERLAKIAAEEAQERERRIKPLSERFVTIFQDVVVKALNERVDELDRPRFRKALVRARFEEFMRVEIDALVGAGSVEEPYENEGASDSKQPQSADTSSTPVDERRSATRETNLSSVQDAAQ